MIHKQIIRILLLVAGLMLAYTQMYGQQYTKGDTAMVKALMDKGYTFLQTEPDSLLYYAEKALSISEKIQFDHGIAKCLSWLGLIYARKGDVKKGKAYLEKSVRIAKANHLLSEETYANNNLAKLYNDEGNYNKALEIAKDNLAIYISLKDSNGIALSYGNIARALSFMNFFEEARSYMFKSLTIFKAIGKESRVATRLSDIAESYLAQDNTKAAKPYLFQSLTACKKLKNIPDTYYPMFNLALCYELEKNNDSAFFYYEKCVELGEELEAEDKQQYSWNGLGAMYLKVGNLQKAEQMLKKALALGEKFENTIIIRDANLNLADLYAQKGDFKAAYTFFQQGSIAKDTLMNEEKIEEMARLNNKLEMREIEMKNEQLQKENELHKLRLVQKNTIIFVVLATMIFLVIVGLLMLRHNRMKTRQAHLELEQKQLRSQMNPHFIFNCLNSIQHYMVYNDIKNANKYLTEFASLMRKTLDILGNDSITLMQEKEYLDNYLLLEQMRFENHFSYEIDIDKNIDIHQVEIPPMIIQPFAENAIRHGFQYLEEEQHGKLSISFQEKENDIICVIDDNGIGREKAEAMKSPNAKKHQSFGIDLTQQRLDLMNKLKHAGFDLKLIDKHNAQGLALGTQVVIKIPKE